MKLVKVLYKKQFDKQEKIIPAYFITTESGKKVMIRPVNNYDYQVLSFLADEVVCAYEQVTNKDTSK